MQDMTNMAGTAYPEVRLFIDGRWVDPEGGAALPVEDPASGQVIGSVPVAGPAEVDAAAAAALAAFPAWSCSRAAERARVLAGAASVIRDRLEPMARVLTLEQGKVLAEARIELAAAADVFDFFASAAGRIEGRLVPSGNAMIQQAVHRRPVGPVAAFTPWNFPATQIARKIGAALAAGCTVVLKAPEETPATPAALVACLEAACLPRGVLNLVYGDPAEISQRLIRHPAIRKISFTGSTAVGRRLAALAGEEMKRATMELGGHAPVIVAADADLDRAVSEMVAAKFRNAGQVCVSPTRFLIEAPLAEAFRARFTEAAASIRVGPGYAPDTGMGPLCHARRRAAVHALVQDAVERGARLLTGGHPVEGPGWFYAPTVLADVPVSARIMNEEPFGPVAILNVVADLDTAMAEANRLAYGLAAYGYARSATTLARLGSGMTAGMVSLNHLGLGRPELPFGGTGDSGMGSEGGPEALDAFLEPRLVTTMMG